MNCPNNYASAEIKTHAQDFIVEEQLGFTLSGDGEHLWCYVEKNNMNTSFLERQWAKIVGCQRRDISHSGLKDRHALTSQWICLPAIYGDKLPEKGEGWRILTRQLHRKKLRIGTHKSNAFTITLRNVVGEQDSINSAFTDIKNHGFINTFASQRFGQDNLANAKQWVARNQLPKKRAERAQVLSTLRAFLFNEQVAYRKQLGLIDQLVAGDRAMLIGSHSHFVVTDIDNTLEQRLRSGDICPAAMLIGKEKTAESMTTAKHIREQALADYAELITYLQTHCQADWREITVRPTELSWQWQSADVLQVAFILPKGSYATSLLGQLFHLVDNSPSQVHSKGSFENKAN